MITMMIATETLTATVTMIRIIVITIMIIDDIRNYCDDNNIKIITSKRRHR